MNIECLKGIIGVTKVDCQCITGDLFDETLPLDWFKESKSGFYIHELEGVVDFDTVKDIIRCEKISTFYSDLINNAIVQVYDDLNGAISERYKKNLPYFSGYLGARTFTKEINVSGSVSGMRIVLNDKRDGILKIRSISVMMNMENTFDLHVYRYYTETGLSEYVETIEGIKSYANRLTSNSLSEPLVLPMNVGNEGNVDYYLLYDSSIMKPMNNIASCGCGRKEAELKKFALFGAVTGEDPEDIGSFKTDDSYNYGLTPDIELSCDYESFVCRMYNHDSNWSRFVAHAVLYQAAAKLHKQVLSSNNITQDLMSNRETVAANMNDFEVEYLERIQYLVQNIDLSVNDCYACNDRKLKVSQILL